MKAGGKRTSKKVFNNSGAAVKWGHTLKLKTKRRRDITFYQRLTFDMICMA